MGNYHEQVVYTPSEDQRWLAGVLMCPTEGAVRSIGIVSLQGTFGYFYVPTSVYLGRALAEQGYRYVSVNTRAREVASMDIPWPYNIHSELQSRLGGEGRYRFDEEPHDVASWIEFLVAQGVEQIVLFGHSGGAHRALYYQAERQDPRVVGLILASGSDRVTAVDPARLELAQRLVAEGQEEALLPVPEGEPMVFGMQSAAHVVHFERAVGRFAAEGHTPWMASIRVPVLATIGASELEDNPDMLARFEGMRRRAVQAPQFDIQVIEGAEHDYTGRERTLAEVVAGWLAALP